MNQVPLPDDWHAQVYEAYSAVLAATMVAPTCITVPFEWMQAYAVTKDPWPSDAAVTFGFVDKPVASVHLTEIQRHFLINRPRAFTDDRQPDTKD